MEILPIKPNKLYNIHQKKLFHCRIDLKSFFFFLTVDFLKLLLILDESSHLLILFNKKACLLANHNISLKMRSQNPAFSYRAPEGLLRCRISITINILRVKINSCLLILSSFDWYNMLDLMIFC